MQDRNVRLLVSLLFLFSGFSGLVYQVLWTRVLTITFGHTVYAVSTVLCAFMSGLALGSLLSSRYADRTRSLVRAYGALELGIGLYALLAYPLFFRLDRLYGPLYETLSGNFAGLMTVRFAMAFLILIVPTTMMGATVPILVRAVTESEGVLGQRAGRLYAINTAGAVIGTLTCGFVLIPVLGMASTNRIAVIVNAVVGLLAIVLPARAAPAPVASGATATRRAGFKWAYAAAGLAGLVALGLEVIWTRTLIFGMFLGSTTYAFSTMLAAFLCGIAAGSFVMGRLADRIANPGRAFFACQAILGVSTVAAIHAVMGGYVHVAGRSAFFKGALVDFLTAVGLMLLPTLMMGASFPLLCRIASPEKDTIGKEVGRVYGANTVGAIFGSLLAGLVLIPLFGIGRSTVLLGVVCPLIGLLPMLGNAGAAPAWGRRGAVVALSVAPMLLLAPRGDFRREFESHGQSVCYYREGNAATITMTEDEKGWKYFYVDNVYVQGSNNMLSMTDIKNLAHVPSLLHPDPKSACTIGFGTGGTSRTFTLYPEYESITCVEIDMNVPAGSACFPESNHGLLEHPDPRYRIHHDDARAFMMNSRRSFDVITVDLADIAYKGNSDVYTLDFLKACRRKLNPGGLNVIWLSVKSLSPENLRVLLRTICNAYPPENVTLWHMTNYPNHDLLLVARKDGPLQIDLPALEKRAAQDEVRRDLREINLDDPMKILTCYYVAAPAIMDYIGDGPLHTVDKPVLEFEAPKDRFRNITMWENLAELFWQIRDPMPPLLGGATAAFQERYRPYLEARDFYLKGELAVLQSGNLMSGSPYFRRARALAPGDQSFLYCLGATDAQLREYEARAAKDPKDHEPHSLAAFAYLFRGELDKGTPELAALARLAPDNPVLHYLKGRYAEAASRWDEATKEYLKFVPVATREYKFEVDARLNAIELTRGSDPEQGNALVEALIKAGEFEKAVTMAEAIFRATGSRADIHLWYALKLRDAGHAYRALQEIEALLGTSPGRAELWYYAGDLLLQLRETAKAEEDLNKALSLDRLNPSIYYDLARLYELRDDKAKARQFLSQAIDLGGPSLAEVAKQDPVFHGSL